MPTITPQVRASIGGSPDQFQLPRKTLTHATGMNMPPREIKPESETVPPAKAGQNDIREETTQAPAVTLSPQMTALARKQQKLQAEINAFKQERIEWERQKADYVPKSDFKARLQQNAAEALKDLGTDYEELTRMQLEQLQGADPVRALQSEIAEIKKSQEDNVNRQYEATIKQYKAEAAAIVSKDPKKYFLVTKEDAQDAIVQHIIDTWEADPDQVLTVEEAANDIEEYLREEARKKKALLEELEGPPAPKPEDKSTEKRLPPPRSGARTLTQQVEATPTRSYGQFQHLSMKERIAQAVARAQR